MALWSQAAEPLRREEQLLELGSERVAPGLSMALALVEERPRVAPRAQAGPGPVERGLFPLAEAERSLAALLRLLDGLTLHPTVHGHDVPYRGSSSSGGVAQRHNGTVPLESPQPVVSRAALVV